MRPPPDTKKPLGANQEASKIRNHYTRTLAEILDLVKEVWRGIKAVVFSGVIP